MTEPATTKSTKTKKPRRWRRRILIFGGIFVLLIGLLPLALALPPVKDLVADKIGERLGRTVRIGKAFAFWGHGIDLEEIQVDSPPGFEAPLARVAKVHADVDLIGLLGGKLGAQVAVFDPHLVIESTADERSNADGVLEALRGKEQEPTSSSGSSGSDIRVRVRGGTYEERRHTDQGITTDRVIEGLNLDLGLTPSGHLAADLDFRAVAAQLGGTDAHLLADIDLDAQGHGPFSVSTPQLELQRLARLVGRIAGLDELDGQLKVTAKGRLLEGQGVAGRFEVGGGDLKARLGTDTRVSIGKLRAVANLHDAADGGAATTPEDTITITLEQVGASGLRDGQRVSFEEPRIELRLAGRYDHEARTLRVREATLAAGAAIAIRIVQPVTLRLDQEALRAEGEVTVEADLTRLGRLATLVPSLGNFRSGRFGARVRANPGEHFELAWSARVIQLDYLVDPAKGESYRDPQIDVTGVVRRNDTGVTELWLNNLQTAAFRRTAEAAARPLYVRLAPEHITINGPLDGDLDLARLQQAAPFLLTTRPGERLSGIIQLRGNARGENETMAAQLRVLGRQLVTPTSWGRPPTPTNVEAQLNVEQRPDALSIDLTSWRGLGIDASAQASFQRTAGTTQLTEARLRAVAQLGEVVPWLVGLELLPPETRMGGRLDADAVLRPVGEARHIEGTSSISAFWWQSAANEPMLREERIDISHDVELGPEGGAHVARKLAITSSALTIETTRARYVPGDDADLDVTATIRGDAARLAAWIKPFLGESYRDLRAQGPIQGQLGARGGLGDHQAHLLVDSRLTLGSWATGGMTLTEVGLEARREALDRPLAIKLRTGLNQGTVALDSNLTLGTPYVPWNATLTVRGVDTSGLVTGQGMSRGLLFMLPSLVPASSQIGALSGRLDVDAQMAAKDLGAPDLMPTLKGHAHVRMAGGEIKNSTLYGSLGGKLGSAGKALSVAVPAVGRVLTGAAKALTFTSIDSKAQVGNQTVRIESAQLLGPYLKVDMKGLVTFEKRVDMEATSTFVGSAGSEAGKFLPNAAIPLRIRGTLDQPQVLPNLSMGDLKLTEGLGDKGKKLIEGLGDDLGGLGKRAKKGLKGLLGG